MPFRWISPNGDRGYAKLTHEDSVSDAVGCAICMQRSVKQIEEPDKATIQIIWQGLSRSGWMVVETE